MKNNNITRTVVIIAACLFLLSMLVSPEFVNILASKKFKQINHPLPAETKNIMYNIDSLDVRTIQYLHQLIVYGWAFIDGRNSDKSTISLVLKSDKNTYIFNSNSIKRYDVTGYFKTFNLDNSGFLATIPWKILENDKYKIGLYINDGDTEAFQYTNEVILKNSNYIYQEKE